MPENLARFIRDYIAPPQPVAARPVPRYDAPWKPTREQKEPPF